MLISGSYPFFACLVLRFLFPFWRLRYLWLLGTTEMTDCLEQAHSSVYNTVMDNLNDLMDKYLLQ